MKRTHAQSASHDQSVRAESIVPSSKSRACSECKRHKIKCERKSGDSSCLRCVRFGHDCVVNNSMQKFIEDDSTWKTKAEAETLQLQAAVSALLRQGNLPELSTYGITEPLQSSKDENLDQNRPMTTSVDMTRDNSPDREVEEPALVSAPMRSLYEVTKLRNLRSNLNSDSPSAVNLLEEDFISKGEISLSEAETCFAFFKKTMNHFLWGGIALIHANLSSVRRSSSLLSAAIITVASLHIPESQKIFRICHNEFSLLVSKSTLTRYHNLDEIRALAIGAFWLSDLSWQLSGHAVRVATEINLHQSLQKVLRGKQNQFEGAQIWYLLYVCDHHFSIAYGRPPVIHEDFAIRNIERFLESPQAGPGDFRLMAQVALFQSLTRAYHAFGSDIEQPLTEENILELAPFNIEIDQWQKLWQPRLADSHVVASYPSKGVVLHYHFAKFQLNSLSLRAMVSNSPLSLYRSQAANLAIHSAMATLNFVLDEKDIRNAIVGVPLFTHTMIAFSAVFLLKISWKWSPSLLDIDQSQVEELVQKIIDLMSNTIASERHLTFHIASGLRKMLEKLSHLRIDPMADTNIGARNGFWDMTIGSQQDMITENGVYNEFGVGYSWSELPMSFDFYPGLTPEGVL